jgi:hypothetical protein
MKREKENLIWDVLGDAEKDASRAAVLSAGGRVLRRKRHTRLAMRCTMLAVIGGLMVLAAQKLGERKNNYPLVAANGNPTSSTGGIHYLTDDELLALFPDTPVGLAKVGGKKKLIFPRPGDEARFISRLPN